MCLRPQDVGAFFEKKEKSRRLTKSVGNGIFIVTVFGHGRGEGTCCACNLRLEGMMVGWTMPDAAAQRSLVSRKRLVGLARGLGEEGKNGPQE